MIQQNSWCVTNVAVFKDLSTLNEHCSTHHKVYPATPKPSVVMQDVIEKCNTCNLNFTKEKNTHQEHQK